MNTRWLRLGLSLVVLLGLVGAGYSAALRATPAEATLLATPVLHNPGFDNTRWYEFKDRYGTWLIGSWVPDDDNGQRLQDWRLWYMRGRPLIKSFPESGIKHAGIESVALRTYDGDVHEGGLYQVIYNVTPCLQYQFQAHGLSRPDAGLPNPDAQLRVGIDPTGWHTNPAVDPAMPGAYPESIVWSAPQDFKYPNFGLLQVTAEALADKITVYTRALAYGGVRHAIVWDSTAFQEVTPAMLQDPAALPAPTLFALATPGTTQAIITWNTPAPAVSQVYYRAVTASGEVPPDYPNKVYLPLVMGGNVVDWQMTPINKTASSAHAFTLTGLIPGQTYEYVVVSRGLSGGACVTWASAPAQFTMLP